MPRSTCDKRIFTPAILFRDLGFLISKAPAVARAMRNPDIGRVFSGKIMMVVTAANGCTCSIWFHAQQAVTSGMSTNGIRDMFDLATYWLMQPAKWLLQRRDRNAAATKIGEKP